MPINEVNELRRLKVNASLIQISPIRNLQFEDELETSQHPG